MDPKSKIRAGQPWAGPGDPARSVDLVLLVIPAKAGIHFATITLSKDGSRLSPG